MTRSVTKDEIDTFRKDGVVCLRGVIDWEWIELLREAMDEAQTSPGPFSHTMTGGDGVMFVDKNLWRRNEKVQRFLNDGPLADLSLQIHGSSSARMYVDQVLLKYPGSKAKSDWHQDLPYFPLSGRQTGTFWVGLDPVTLASGAVQFIRGSHLWGKLYNPVGVGGVQDDPPPGYERVPDIADHLEDYDVIHFDLEPGDCTLHDLRTLHGGPANTSTSTPRRGYVVRMLGDDIVYRDRPTSRDSDPRLSDGIAFSGDLYPLLRPA